MPARMVRHAASMRYFGAGSLLAGASPARAGERQLVRLSPWAALSGKDLGSTGPGAGADGMKTKSAVTMETPPERWSGSAAPRK